MCYDSKKSGFVVDKVNDMLRELNIPIINNNNIVKKHAVAKGLYLNQYGRLVMNYIAAVKKL